MGNSEIYIAENGEIACPEHATGSLPRWGRMSLTDITWWVRHEGELPKCETCESRRKVAEKRAAK